VPADVIVCEISNPTKRVIDEPPIVRNTEQRGSGRGTIGGSSTDRDYRMSIYDGAIILHDYICHLLAYGHSKVRRLFDMRRDSKESDVEQPQVTVA
jgi:hypothetical protein